MAKSNCDNCYYCKKLNADRYCAYLLMTNQKRPCEPGEGCTVKVPRSVKRRKEQK